ncbi:SPFH domain-containing protein [Corynebacterium cystitidis]|uniref:SPFH domain-containing protein n=1 Tax=Corynebacterium cystitidis TaxID=35757 RepID=UPI00211EA80B|nr:SPFH domain-containing protein [Corynebacterium cystitidis]
MAFFRRRKADFGWTMHAGQSALSEQWLPSDGMFSPAQVPGHAVLRSRNGVVEQLHERELARSGDRFRLVDLRRRHLSISPQQVPTSEGIDVTLTFVLSIRVSDPLAYVQASVDPESEVYLAAQIALRELVAVTPLDQMIGRRVDLSSVATAAVAAGNKVGIDVAPNVRLKDFSLPREISSAVDRAVVDKLNAQADLERARTEVKVTRARMGTAKVLEQNPLLAKLALLEALPPGTTLEVKQSEESA